MGDFDRWGGGSARRRSSEHGAGDGRDRDNWDRTTQDFIRTISNPSPRGEEERRWRRGGGGGERGERAEASSSSYNTRYDHDRGFDERFRGGSSEHYGRRGRGISPPYDYRRRTSEGREGSRDGSWRSKSPPRSRSRSPRSLEFPPSSSERELELRRLERDTLRIGVADKAAASEVDLREVLDIGRKAKEAVASGMVRNLKNAAARTLQSQQQQQPQQAPDAHLDVRSHPLSQDFPFLGPNISHPSRGNVTGKGDNSGRPRPQHDVGSGESMNKLRAGNYLVATWDAMTDGHQYDGVISQVGAYLPHGVTYVKHFLDEKIAPEDMEHYVVMPGGRVFLRFNKSYIIPISTTELGLKEFLEFLER